MSTHRHNKTFLKLAKPILKSACIKNVLFFCFYSILTKGRGYFGVQASEPLCPFLWST